jgi:hypothetical protein
MNTYPELEISHSDLTCPLRPAVLATSTYSRDVFEGSRAPLAFVTGKPHLAAENGSLKESKSPPTDPRSVR